MNAGPPVVPRRADRGAREFPILARGPPPHWSNKDRGPANDSETSDSADATLGDVRCEEVGLVNPDVMISIRLVDSERQHYSSPQDFAHVGKTSVVLLLAVEGESTSHKIHI
jgi:hypothetical protein